MSDHPLPMVALGLLVLFAFWVVGTRTQEHHLRAQFSSALSMTSGLDVQIDGVDVGKVGDVEYSDGRAVVELGIEDDAWPLPRGTTATLRFGTTLGNGTRRVDLEPGPKSAPALPEDGLIAERNTSAPVEFDQVFNTFDRRTRRHLQSMLAGTGETVRGRSGHLNTGVKRSAPALGSAAALLGDLAADQGALDALVTNAHRATRTLGARQATVSDVVSVAAETFDEFGANSLDVRRSIEEFAPTLRQTRATLARADSSIDGLDALMADLKPGVRELRPFLTRARPAVNRLARTAPLARRTLSTLRRTGPGITRLLREGQPFARRLDPVLGRLAPQLACVRPYAPEIGGFFSNWNGWAKNYDDSSHYARVKINAGPTSFTDFQPIDSDEFLDLIGKANKYAMPRPPGLNAGQPWLLPQCGAGKDALDPAKDPEDR